MRSLKIYNIFPFEPVKGEGVTLIDRNGKKYIDLVSGLGVNLLGYNDKYIKKILSHTPSIIHLSNLYYSSLREEVADMLGNLTDLDYVFFTNSGTEANEAGLKFAWKSKKGKFIALIDSFHGRTLGSYSLSHLFSHQDFPRIKADIKFIDTENYDDLKREGKDAAIIMFEPIQGAGGVKPLTREAAEIMSDLQKSGVILFADEVQSGLGRTGKFLACEHYNLKPDIVTLAKGLGGGLPLGAVIMKKNIAEKVSIGDHGSTMGGNMLSLRLAKEVLRRLNSGLIEYVQKLGEYIDNKYKDKFKIRGKGLFRGFDINNADTVQVKMINRGFLINILRKKTIRLLPPLIITKETIDSFFENIEDIIE